MQARCQSEAYQGSMHKAPKYCGAHTYKRQPKIYVLVGHNS